MGERLACFLPTYGARRRRRYDHSLAFFCRKIRICAILHQAPRSGRFQIESLPLQENLAQLLTIDMQYYKGAFVILNVNCCQLSDIFLQCTVPFEFVDVKIDLEFSAQKLIRSFDLGAPYQVGIYDNRLLHDPSEKIKSTRETISTENYHDKTSSPNDVLDCD